MPVKDSSDPHVRRIRTAEEIARLRERGLIDVGTMYVPLTGAEKVLRRRNWITEDEA